MANVPEIANIKISGTGNAGAARADKAKAAAKRAGDGNPETTFEKALKDARGSESSEGDRTKVSKMSAGVGKKPLKRNAASHKKSHVEISEHLPSADRFLTKSESALNVEKNPAGGKSAPAILASEERIAPEVRAESKAAEAGRHGEIPAEAAGSEMALEHRTKRGGKTASDSADREERVAGSVPKARDGIGKLKAEALSTKASRVVVEDKRTPKEEMRSAEAPSIRTKVRGHERKPSGEPVVFRLDSSGSNGSANGFAVAETEIDLSAFKGEGRSAVENASAELSRRLDAQEGNEIVRQVKVVLNRANAGEVRINLRPENMGRVRVRIRMEDNRLTGRIFVESAAAREAFRGALDGLQAKLVESGFGAADLELAWDGGPSDDAQFGRGKGRETKNRGEASREFDGMSATVGQEDVRIGDGRVDMVV